MDGDMIGGFCISFYLKILPGAENPISFASLYNLWSFLLVVFARKCHACAWEHLVAYRGCLKLLCLHFLFLMVFPSLRGGTSGREGASVANVGTFILSLRTAFGC